MPAPFSGSRHFFTIETKNPYEHRIADGGESYAEKETTH